MDKLFHGDELDFHNGTTPSLNDANMGAIVNGLDAVDTRVAQIGTLAENTLQTSIINAANAVAAANNASKDAESAAASAEKAMSGTPEGYATLVDTVDHIYEDLLRDEDKIALIEADTDLIAKNVGKYKNLFDAPNGYSYYGTNYSLTGNDDGTFTLNGTNRYYDDVVIELGEVTLEAGLYKWLGTPQGGSPSTYSLNLFGKNSSYKDDDYGDGSEGYLDADTYIVVIVFRKGASANNAIFKPMITTNRSATYDDFVPYTGSGKTILNDMNATRSMISEAWTNIYTYSVGEFAIHNNTLYRCKAQCRGIEPPNETYWEQTSIASELRKKLK